MTFVVLTGSDSFNRLGWMVGTGVEYAVTNNLILKAEYNYVDFGSNNETLTINSTLSGAATASINSKLAMNVVKFGVNRLFNGY